MINRKNLKEETLKYIQENIDNWVTEASSDFEIDDAIDYNIVKKLILFGCYTMTHEIVDGLEE